METILAGVVFLVVGILAGYAGRRYFAGKKLGSAEEQSARRLTEAETKSKEIILDAKEKAAAFLADAKNEERERHKELDTLETRLVSREELLDKRASDFSREENAVRAREDALRSKEEGITKRESEAEHKIEEVAKLSMKDAQEQILRRAKEDRAQDLAQTIQKIDRENHEEIEKKAIGIITTALQRYARSHVSDITTTIFPIGDDDMKGKIIGREGRNIRALERATGVEFLVDEAPDGIIISSFDPYRREVARLALEKLVKDGRIQPAKIEEKVEEAKNELVKRTQEIGDAAAQDLGIFDLPKELLQLLGRLHFRTSFGQNALTHSIEVAYLAEMMARELGLDADAAKRGGCSMISARRSTMKWRGRTWSLV